MKRLFLVFVWLVTTQIQAQIVYTQSGTDFYDSTDYEFPAKWTNLFSEIDLSTVNTGYLIDRAINWIDPQKHTGQLEVDDTTHFETICSMHTAFQMANLGDTATLLDSTDVLRNKVDTYTANHITPLVLFDVDYNYILPDVLANGILELTEADPVIRSGPNAWMGIYGQNNAFAIAPGADRFEQGMLTWMLPSDLVLSNTGMDISGVTIHFSNTDIYYILYPDVPLTIDATQFEGDMLAEFIVWYANGRVQGGISPVFFQKRASLPVYDYDPSNDWHIIPTSNHSGATVTIALGCGKTQLTKPLIILEPFDPLNDFNYSETLLKLIRYEETKELLEELEAQGYDLVYIDYNNGGDFIERNTALFKQILNEINTLKHANGSTDANMVLGISMGGVIGHLGLKQLENENIDHETDVFFSLDAPHKGAYVPRSIQLLMKQLESISQIKEIRVRTPWFLPDVNVNIEGEIKELFNLPKSFRDGITTINCPAAKQLLISNVYDNNEMFVKNRDSVWTGPANKAFYDYYLTFGGLSNCREIAISNGSIAAKGQQYPSDLGYDFLPDNMLIGELTSKQVAMFPLIASATLNIDFKLRGLPENQPSAEFYKGDINLYVQVWNGFSVSGTTTKISSWYRYSSANSEGFMSYDNAPGGYQSVKSFTGGNINTLSHSIGGTVGVYVDQFCFVPSISSNALNTSDLRYPYVYDLSQIQIDVPIPGGGTEPHFIYSPTNNITFFKSLSAPSTTSANNHFWNESHSIPTSQSGFILATEILGSSRAYDEAIQQLLSISGGELYFYPLNFGYQKSTSPSNPSFTTGNVLYHSITCSSLSSLQINTSTPILLPDIYSSSFNTFIPDPNSVFTLSLSGKGCGKEPITVIMRNTSTMELGSSTDNRSGILNINNNATVRFEYGSALILHNSSKIIVHNGSTLVFDEYVNVQLSDNESSIEFEPGANLVLSNGFHFTYTGNGFICFTGGDGTKSVNITGNGLLNIMGTGKTDKVLEFKPFNSNNKINITSTYPITVDGGQIISSAHVTFSAPIIFSYCAINGGYYYFNKPLTSANTDWDIADAYCFSNTSITNGIFNGQLTGSNIYTGNDVLYINDVIFSQLDANALKVYNSKTEIFNSSFLNSSEPIKFEAQSFDTYLEGIYVQTNSQNGPPISGGKGVYFSGATGGSLNIIRCNILNQKVSGLVVNNAPVSISCSRIKTTGYSSGNPAAITISNSASLIMDPTLAAFGGRSDLSGYRTTIQAYYASDIQINNAYSNLSSDLDAFEGSMTKDYSMYVNELWANNNYWKWAESPSQTNHFYSFYYAVPNPYIEGQFDYKRFGNSGNGTVMVNSILTTPPDLASLCPTLMQDDNPEYGKQGESDISENYFVKNISNITTPSGSTLNEELHNIYKSKNYSVSFASCKNILFSDFHHSDPNKVGSLKGIVYDKMLSLLGTGYSQKQIVYGMPTPETELLKQIQLSLISTTFKNNQQKAFDLTVDYLLTLRLEHNYNRALLLLDSLLASDDGRHHDFLNKWICQLTQENMLVQGLITPVEFAKTIWNCDKIETAKPQTTPFTDLVPNKTDGKTPISDAITVFPNPSNEMMTINLPEGTLVNSISLFNIQGVEVLSAIPNITNNEVKISVADLPPGIYLLKIKLAQGSFEHKISVLH